MAQEQEQAQEIRERQRRRLLLALLGTAWQARPERELGELLLAGIPRGEHAGAWLGRATAAELVGAAIVSCGQEKELGALLAKLA